VAFADQLVRGFNEPSRLLGLGQGFIDGACQILWRAGFRQPSGSFEDDFTNAPGIRRDDRHTERHRIQN
jgi:hypothetical protein